MDKKRTFKMATMTGTTKRLAAYAQPWKEVKGCYDVEQRMAWGISIFRRLVEEEGRIQRSAMGKTTPELEAFFSVMPLVYSAWARASEEHLARAEELEKIGDSLDGIEEFREAIVEARMLVELLESEGEIPSMGELLASLETTCGSPGGFGA